MSGLLDMVLKAHGGLERWRALSHLRVHAHITGELWHRRGQGDVLADTIVALDPHHQAATFHDFKQDGCEGLFRPDGVKIEDATGTIIAEREDPASAFASQTKTSPWDDLSLIYCAGFDFWAFLIGPFAFTMDGVSFEEVEPGSGRIAGMRRLQVTFPESLVMHARQQTYTFDETGEMLEYQYEPRHGGVVSNINLVANYRTFNGLHFPTTRTMLPQDEQGQAKGEPVLMAVRVVDIIAT